MSINISAEVRFVATTDKGVYYVWLRDGREGTNIGTVFQDDSGWKTYNHDKKFTGHGDTRYMAARGLLEDYELANGLRDSEGRRVGRDPEVLGFWCVLSFAGTRESERWTDKADAIAHLASLQQPVAKTNGNVVWSADKGWHDGLAATTELDDAGRIVSTPVPETEQGLPESLTVFGKVFTDPADIKALWAAWTDEQRATYRAAQVDAKRVEITPVLAWSDGTVTGGVKELTDRLTGQAYGHGTDDEFTLYVTQGGALHLASTRQLSQKMDADEWISEQYGVYVGDATEPVLILHLRIDGRA